MLVFLVAWIFCDFKESKPVVLNENSDYYIVRVKNVPVVKTKSLQMQADLYIKQLSKSQTVQLTVLTDSCLENAIFEAGDFLLIKTKLTLPQAPQNPGSLNEKIYFRRKGIEYKAILYSSQIRIIKKGGFSFEKLAGSIRQKLISLFRSGGISEQRLAVLVALSLGQKSGLESEVRTDFSSAGAMHVLAVSGLHIGIVYFIINQLIGFIFPKRSKAIFRSLAVIALLWLYALITGLSPSVNRATTMFSLISIGTTYSRKTLVYNTISIAAFVLLYLRPQVLFDLGFQLSFAAVTGIVYFQPLIKELFQPKNVVVKWGWDLMVVSLAAQIATLPLGLYYFGQFPVYFLLTNLIVIPLTTLILYLTVISMFFVFWEPFFQVISSVLNGTLGLIMKSVEFIAGLPGAVFQYKINLPQLICMYLIVLAIAWWISKRRFASLALVFFGMIFITGVDLVRFLKRLSLSEVLVYSDNKNSQIEFIKTGFSRVFSTDSLEFKRISCNFHLMEMIRFDRFDQTLISPQLLNFQGENMLIIRDNKSFRNKDSLKMSVPAEFLLIVTGKAGYNSLEYLDRFIVKQCVIESSVSRKLAEELKTKCKRLQISYHDCKSDGAYNRKFFSNFVHN